MKTRQILSLVILAGASLPLALPAQSRERTATLRSTVYQNTVSENIIASLSVSPECDITEIVVLSGSFNVTLSDGTKININRGGGSVVNAGGTFTGPAAATFLKAFDPSAYATFMDIANQALALVEESIDLNYFPAVVLHAAYYGASLSLLDFDAGVLASAANTLTLEGITPTDRVRGVRPTEIVIDDKQIVTPSGV